jgi:hypothetical protein
MLRVVTALLTAQLTPVSGAPLTPPQINLDPTGWCEGSGGRIDLHRVMFLENRTLEVDGGTGPLLLRLEDETFYSDEIGERSRHRTYFDKIDALVQPSEDLDIELKFAVVNGRLTLYWRETYQNRFYRHGLLSLEGRALFGDNAQAMIPLCAGRGGHESGD